LVGFEDVFCFDWQLKEAAELTEEDVLRTDLRGGGGREVS
jgi:hypothetical protein